MTNAEALQYLIAVDLPISADDLNQIEAMLRTEAPFCTSFPDEDAYSVALYHEQSAVHGSNIRMLVDRNVFARVVALANGARAKQADRIPAAIMTFAQCAGIEIEPNLALYESVATQTQNRAAHDLAMFRAADNLHPSEFADIALGRASKLRNPLSPASDNSNLTALKQRIRQYSFVYPLVLKVGLVELEGGPMAQRMRRFLDWTCENWYFSAPVTTFAAICFSAAPPRSVLKYLRHPDRSRALAGLRNCAWDLTYVTWWGELLKRQNHETRLYLLCSCDKALRCVAQQLLARPHIEEEEIGKALIDLLGTAVYNHYAQLIERKNGPDRMINRMRTDIANYEAQVTAALEQQLLQNR